MIEYQSSFGNQCMNREILFIYQVHAWFCTNQIEREGFWKTYHGHCQAVASILAFSAWYPGEHWFRQSWQSRINAFTWISHIVKMIIIEERINALWTCPVIIYLNVLFCTPGNAIEYLGRYTHLIAITNTRIKSVTQESVFFYRVKFPVFGVRISLIQICKVKDATAPLKR